MISIMSVPIRWIWLAEMGRKKNAKREDNTITINISNLFEKSPETVSIVLLFVFQQKVKSLNLTNIYMYQK